MSDKPEPIISDVSRPFWAATAAGHLAVQQCQGCNFAFLYPRVLCPRCWSPELSWVPTSGRGRVVACTVVHQATDDAFKDALPYALAIVRLDEGPQLMSNIVGELVNVHVGEEVDVVFEQRGAFQLPQFTPVPAGSRS